MSVLVPAEAVSAASGSAPSGYVKRNPLCNRLGKKLQASAGAQMFCFGPQPRRSTTPSSPSTVRPAERASAWSRNVNAANLSEDVSPSGARAYGQSETSIAASGNYVVEAWNDATAFWTPPCDPSTKGSGTGFGFSNNGGATFKDLGGLPNTRCSSARAVIAGDPSVEVYTVNGTTYFYIASIFIELTRARNALSVTRCTVVGSGTSATLSCGDPTIAAVSSDCVNDPFFGTFCSFLDKEYLTIDPVRQRLYMSYTEFGVSTFEKSNGIVELAVCDLATPSTPACRNGSAATIQAPYLIVAPGVGCEQEGAYPAVDVATGDVYVTWEYNWFTNIFGGQFGEPVDCRTRRTVNTLARVPSACLTLPARSCGVSNRAYVPITSMDAAFVPGYSRFPANDFPRIAVSGAAGTVSMVWNDAGRNPMGDIYLQSFNRGSLTRVQSGPVTLNDDTSGIALHFMPALRNADSNGRLNVSWYDRRLAPNSARTDVYAALGIDPRLSATPEDNVRVTDVSSDWNVVSSDIDPNFGDYTDNYVATGDVFHVAWSDGRLVVPQPFTSHVTLRH